MAIENMSSINFVVETQIVSADRKLKAAVFDADGYTEVPVAVLGEVSQNNTYYIVDPLVREMTNKDSIFNRLLVDGKIYGEYTHPDLSGLNRQQALERLIEVRGTCQSHHIRRLYTGAKLPDGGILLMASVRPMGPYRDELLDNFMNAYANTAFSLRAIVADKQGNDGVLYRTCQKLVTFDSVLAGGYFAASKRYAPAVENLQRSDFMTQSNEVALESFTVKDIDAMFGCIEVRRERQVIGTFTPGQESFVDTNGERRSLFHHFAKSVK